MLAGHVDGKESEVGPVDGEYFALQISYIFVI